MDKDALALAQFPELLPGYSRTILLTIAHAEPLEAHSLLTQSLLKLELHRCASASANCTDVLLEAGNARLSCAWWQHVSIL